MSAVTATSDRLAEEGMTPAIALQLRRAAALVREAAQVIGRAIEEAPEGSDLYSRLINAAGDMDGALYMLEWTPPAED